jgi:hypothetical protein
MRIQMGNTFKEDLPLQYTHSINFGFHPIYTNF